MSKLEEHLASIPEMAPPLSLVSAYKYANEPITTATPTTISFYHAGKSFYSPLYQRWKGNQDLVQNFVDSTGQYGRITSFMRDVNADVWKP